MPFVIGECCSLVRHEHRYEEDGEHLGLAPMRDPMLDSSCFDEEEEEEEEEELQTAPTWETLLSPVLPSIAGKEAILRILAELRRFGLLP